MADLGGNLHRTLRIRLNPISQPVCQGRKLNPNSEAGGRSSVVLAADRVRNGRSRRKPSSDFANPPQSHFTTSLPGSKIEPEFRSWRAIKRGIGSGSGEEWPISEETFIGLCESASIPFHNQFARVEN